MDSIQPSPAKSPSLPPLRNVGLLTTAVCLLALGVLSISPPRLSAYTQSGAGTFIGNGIPMGHEWLTRMAALELIGGDPIVTPDPNDPRKTWNGKAGKAKNLNLSSAAASAEVQRIREKGIDDDRYESTYQFIFDAIVGERWVDIGGFNVTKSLMGKYDAFAVIAQEPADLQYDHFIRRFDDYGPQGGIDAAKRSQQRFIEHFVNAAIAPDTQIRVWDGGGYSVDEVVDLNYFLFGRAVHLFQDAFSTEHVVRLADDRYERIRQVKSYLCAAGCEQHSHSQSEVTDYTSGDVIWNPGTRSDAGWDGYKASNMKPDALVALEASKDLWAAFIRTMGLPIERREAAARSEARQLIKAWLNFDEQEMLSWYSDPKRRDESYVVGPNDSGKGISQATAMSQLGFKSLNQASRARQIEQQRRICLYNIEAEHGYEDLWDPYMRIPYYWKWKSSKWLEPPADWKPPRRPANSGIRVRIRSAHNGEYLTVPEGLGEDNGVYAKPGTAQLELILVGSKESCVFRAAGNPELFLSYRDVSGRAKLEESTLWGDFKLEKVGEHWALFNLHYEQYFWLDGDRPRLNRKGSKDQSTAHWIIEGLE